MKEMEADFLVEGWRLTAAQRKAVGFLREYAKRMVTFGFPGHKTPVGVSKLMREVYRAIDEMIAGCLENGTKPACKSGCAWCCFMRVRVTPLEVLSILDFLHTHLDTDRLSALKQRLATTDAITRGMDGIQRGRAKIACPLLADRKCLVYPVRPMACRVYHSLNSSECEMRLDDQERTVQIRQDISALNMGISAGLMEGLRTAGLQARQLELVAGLRMAMDEQGVVERWFAGEPAFAGAEVA